MKHAVYIENDEGTLSERQRGREGVERERERERENAIAKLNENLITSEVHEKQVMFFRPILRGIRLFIGYITIEVFFKDLNKEYLKLSWAEMRWKIAMHSWLDEKRNLEG